MKKMFVLVSVTIMSHFSFAQVKEGRDTAVSKNNPVVSHKMHHKEDRHTRKEIMKELNLNEAQKAQLKEIRISDKEKRAAILNDAKLTEEQKDEELKELHAAQIKNLQNILTEEQKVKMKDVRKKVKAELEANPNKMHSKRTKDDRTQATEPGKQ